MGLTKTTLAHQEHGGNDNVPTVSAMTHAIALVVFNDFQILDAAGPIAAFEIADRYRPGSYALTVAATAPGAVRSSSGVCMTARALPDLTAFDTVLVSGGDGSRAAMGDQALLGAVKAAATAGRRVASVCSGAFVLAQAGVLHGRRATTHWSRTDDFARRFPGVRLEADRIWTRDGDIWTSAGITAGIDLALAMIADDLGESVARRTAQQLVVYHRRPGGQSQFSALLEMDGGGGAFGPVLAWARETSRSAPSGGAVGGASGHEFRGISPGNSLPMSALRRRAPLSACAWRSRATRSKAHPPPSTRSPARPDLPTRSGCGAPSSGPSDSRPRPCAAPPGRGERQALRRPLKRSPTRPDRECRPPLTRPCRWTPARG